MFITEPTITQPFSLLFARPSVQVRWNVCWRSTARTRSLCDASASTTIRSSIRSNCVTTRRWASQRVRWAPQRYEIAYASAIHSIIRYVHPYIKTHAHTHKQNKHTKHTNKTIYYYTILHYITCINRQRYTNIYYIRPSTAQTHSQKNKHIKRTRTFDLPIDHTIDHYHFIYALYKYIYIYTVINKQKHSCHSPYIRVSLILCCVSARVFSKRETKTKAIFVHENRHVIAFHCRHRWHANAQVAYAVTAAAERV